ncbi:hypothetical protein OLMES_4812 [Oleiphilus messinensis]|uniref:Uncharacterized protein n=1 Tax=Oleiphilus messinensis TaxID=141451 RepID=A0A1Y0IED7_9GAMM|nr:hypothetical protein [Oleiphilus messinensis]ARU58801.1 hypothetical protein OLMES_4812 [Oleiphilus messinensis]
MEKVNWERGFQGIQANQNTLFAGFGNILIYLDQTSDVAVMIVLPTLIGKRFWIPETCYPLTLITGSRYREPL